ncbi:MAG: hypothetical protein KDA81_09040 [Planctomycetaceae bacterium]|nr:hypothetical protein [Planctomycetaceae bacterium]
MKRKYYPQLTLLAAIILTLAPLCLVLLISSWASETDFPDDVPIADARMPGDFAPNARHVNREGDRSQPEKSAVNSLRSEQHVVAAHDRLHAAKTTAGTSNETSEGMTHRPQESYSLSDTSPGDASTIASVASSVPNTSVSGYPRVAMLDGNPAIASDAPPTFPVPAEGIPTVSGPSSLGIAGSTYRDFPGAKANHDAGSAASMEARPAGSPPGAMSPGGGLAVGNFSPGSVLVEPTIPTPFDATGHMAMTSSVGLGSAARGAPSSGNRSQSSPGPASPGLPTSNAPSTEARLPWEAAAGIKDATPAAPPEDVILQQPLDGSRVSQMENLVAVTNARGWPVALVKSGLPGDVWWVQQMVGIRGNAFAARVNFGNEESIPGSVYHLVFVFLDSADEMRRFRISRQFKTLPDGLRKSREFTFIRQ